MNFEVKQAILNKIKEYDTIFLFRHIRNDGDCVGATKGMKAILQASFPEKKIYLIDNDRSAYLSFLGPEDEEVDEACYAGALAIVLDTSRSMQNFSRLRIAKQAAIQLLNMLDDDDYLDYSDLEDYLADPVEDPADYTAE